MKKPPIRFMPSPRKPPLWLREWTREEVAAHRRMIAAAEARARAMGWKLRP